MKRIVGFLFVCVALTGPATALTVSEARAAYGSCGEHYDTAIAVGWPDTEWRSLSRVMRRESECNAAAFNGNARTGDRSYGLLQINVRGSLWGDRQRLCKLTAASDLLDPATNLGCGLRLWKRSGWQPWRATY